jgi:hypothetical protein
MEQANISAKKSRMTPQPTPEQPPRPNPTLSFSQSKIHPNASSLRIPDRQPGRSCISFSLLNGYENKLPRRREVHEVHEVHEELGKTLRVLRVLVEIFIAIGTADLTAVTQRTHCLRSFIQFS